MVKRSGAGLKPGKTDSVNAGDKDRLIAELKERVAIMENELRLYRGKAGTSDFVERRRAEEALRTDEESYRGLVESTGDWLWETDENFILTYDSPLGMKVLGYEPDEVIGKSPFSFMPADELERIRPAAWPAISRHEPLMRIENRLMKKDGSIATVETTAIPLFDESGRYRGYRGVNHDVTEHKRAEEALKLTQFALDNFGEPAIWITKDGGITYVNQAACMALGYSKEELLSMHIGDIDPNYPKDKIRELWYVRKQDRNTKFESVHVTRDGRAFPVEVTSCYLQYGNDEFLITFDRDITERKRAEEALRNSEQLLRNMFDCIQDGITVLDKDLNVVRTNHTLEEWHPHMMPIAGKKCYYAFHTRDSPCQVCPSVRAIKEKSIQSATVPFSGEGGEQRGWLEIYAYPMLDDRGDVTGVVEHVRNITERKRAEEALSRNLAVLARSQQVARLGSWSLDLDSEKYEISDEIYQVYGIKRDVAKPSHDLLRELVHPDDLDKLDEYYQAVREGRLGDIEYRIVKEDGSVHHVYVVTDSIVRRPDGRVKTASGISQDITDRKLAEEALREAKAQAELYVDLMGHDINNMNQISLGFLELAHNIIEMDGKLGEDNVVLLEKSMDALKDSSRLIDNVRKLQRERMGMYKPEVIDICDMIKDTVEQFQGIPGRNIKVAYDAPGHCLVRANGLLKDVFINLIGNAVKHSRGDLNVNVRVDRVSDGGRSYSRVAVEDDGPGIPDQLKETLFDRLNLASTRAKGKGFGLCLIKLLVDDYGGKFWVEDRVPGDHRKGARFVVMLPAV